MGEHNAVRRGFCSTGVLFDWVLFDWVLFDRVLNRRRRGRLASAA
jgi:hypothetical protein